MNKSEDFEATKNDRIGSLAVIGFIACNLLYALYGLATDDGCIEGYGVDSVNLIVCGDHLKIVASVEGIILLIFLMIHIRKFKRI